MAGIQAAAGLQPYLQFGEVQWWYFPNDGDGHPFSRDAVLRCVESERSFWRSSGMR